MSKKNSGILWLFGIGVALFALGKRAKGSTVDTGAGTASNRNNPGNIKNLPGSGKFKGETSSASDKWKSFESLPYGYRAMIVLLRNYYNKGYKTLKQVIGRYAPSSENPTSNYIQYVSSKIGVDPNADLHDIIFYEDVKGLIAAMSQLEQGKSFAVNDSDLKQAYNLV